jgi:hypothetical protein
MRNLEKFWELNTPSSKFGPLTKALFRWREKLKTFQDFQSHQIFARMHEALNIDKKITNCIVCL